MTTFMQTSFLRINYHTFSRVEFSPGKVSNNNEVKLKRRGRPKKGQENNSNKMIVTKTEPVANWTDISSRKIAKKHYKQTKVSSKKKPKETKQITATPECQTPSSSNNRIESRRIIRTSISIKELLN